jgi:hypothetical protein
MQCSDTLSKNKLSITEVVFRASFGIGIDGDYDVAKKPADKIHNIMQSMSHKMNVFLSRKVKNGSLPRLMHIHQYTPIIFWAAMMSYDETKNVCQAIQVAFLARI